MPNPCDDAKETVVDELSSMKTEIRETKASPATFFAVFCVLMVLVGNVTLLIAINFWISVMPVDSLAHNSSQIAIQVVAMILMIAFFSIFVAIFLVLYGYRPLVVILMSTDRMKGPWYRLFLLFASGATNGISSILSIYAMTYIAQFLQAVLLCAIPFSAQAWTILFISEERKRNYVSLFFVSSFVFFVAGVIVSSLSTFIDDNEGSSVPWTLIYLASALVFGLWCVVQRLYLDAIQIRGEEGNVVPSHTVAGAVEVVLQDSDDEMEGAKLHMKREREDRDAVSSPENEPAANEEVVFTTTNDPTVTTAGAKQQQQQHRRVWAKQDCDDLAAKLTLVFLGVLFEALVIFLCFPVDAIPWFGTSSSVGEAWGAFTYSVSYIFESWDHIRYGCLYSLGFAMSFIGCSYLNEQSPTLSSVVLQLAGPVTSLMIVIVPAWNVYDEQSHTAQKIGGIVLLFMAAVLYHFWDTHSAKQLLLAQQEAREEEEELAQSRLVSSIE